MGNPGGRDFVLFGMLGVNQAERRPGGRSVDVSGLFAASRGKAGRPTRVPSEDGMTRDGEKGSQ